MTADQRVALGASLLDQARPGWAAQLDLDRLNIRSSSHCVLGQLYGWNGFTAGINQLALRATGASTNHGFVPTCGLESGWECRCADDNVALVRAWVAAVADRLANPAPVHTNQEHPHEILTTV